MQRFSWILPLVVTLVVVPLIVWEFLSPGHFQFWETPHPERLQTINIGGLAGLLGLVWFSWRRRRIAEKYSSSQAWPSIGLIGWLALWVLGCAGTTAAQSVVQVTDWHRWVSDSLSGGLLSYYLASLVFVVKLANTALRPFPWAKEKYDTREWRTQTVVCQWWIFGIGLGLLGIGYPLLTRATSLAVLSWAIFFVIDDWSLLEHFVVFGANRLPWWHYAVMVLFNILIAVGCVWTVYDLLPLIDTTAERGWVRTGWFFRRMMFWMAVLLGVLGCAYSAFLLYQFARRPKANGDGTTP